MSASTYWFRWKISKIYRAVATKIGSWEARHHQLMTHLCPLRGQCVGQSCPWVCFLLAGMEPQDMIRWRNNTNNLPDFINNYILQRDNVGIDENPLKPRRGGLSKLAHKCPCNFLFQLDLRYFICIAALLKGNTPMNSWTTKQTLQLCWYVNVGQRCQESKKAIMNVNHVLKSMYAAKCGQA